MEMHRPSRIVDKKVMFDIITLIREMQSSNAARHARTTLQR
jgi:hypothetical protein